MISLACIATLSRGLGLLHPDVTMHSRATALIHGVYGLMMYCLEFWQHHVLSYAASGGDISSDSALMKSLLELWSTHDRIRKAKNHMEIDIHAVATTSTLPSLDARLQLIKNPAVFALLYETLKLRHAAQEEILRDGKGKYMF